MCFQIIPMWEKHKHSSHVSKVFGETSDLENVALSGCCRVWRRARCPRTRNIKARQCLEPGSRPVTAHFHWKDYRSFSQISPQSSLCDWVTWHPPSPSFFSLAPPPPIPHSVCQLLSNFIPLWLIHVKQKKIKASFSDDGWTWYITVKPNVGKDGIQELQWLVHSIITMRDRTQEDGDNNFSRVIPWHRVLGKLPWQREDRTQRFMSL